MSAIDAFMRYHSEITIHKNLLTHRLFVIKGKFIPIISLLRAPIIQNNHS